MSEPTQTTVWAELDFQIKRETVIAPSRRIIGWRWDATRGVIREPTPDYLAITREIVEGSVSNGD